MTYLPEGLWTVHVRGQYVRPNGQPHRGYILFCPTVLSVSAVLGGTPHVITVDPARVDMGRSGEVDLNLLNPNDPMISPGPATGDSWGYRVFETYQRGSVLEWKLDVPSDVGDGDELDLAMVPRKGEKVCRPADWFPRHLIDTPVQASRISPRNGPLMRNLDI